MKVTSATISAVILALSIGVATAAPVETATASIPEDPITADETNAFSSAVVDKREAAPEPYIRGHPRANWGLTGPQKREAEAEAEAEAEPWMRGHDRANWGLTGPQKREAEANPEPYIRGHPRANWGLTGPQKREAEAAPEAEAEAEPEAWMRGNPRANWGLTGP